MIPNTNNQGHVGYSHLRHSGGISNKATKPAPWTSVMATQPKRHMHHLQKMPAQYNKAVQSRNAQYAQAKQFIQGVKDLNQMKTDLIAKQKASKAALVQKQKARQQRHQNIGRPARQSKIAQNAGPLQNSQSNHTNRSQTAKLRSGGGPGGPGKLPSNNKQSFLSGFKGTPRTLQQLQYQLRASYSPRDLKQAIADGQVSRLSSQDYVRYQSALKRAVMNLASNPDTAHQIDRSFIEQALSRDKSTASHTIMCWEKADVAHMAERNDLLKQGKVYTPPFIKPQPDCSYKELHRQFTQITSINDLKAVVANRAATNITPAEQGKYQGALSAVLRGMAKNPDFAADLHEGFIDYALQGDRRAKNEILSLRDKTLTGMLERRLDRLKRR